MKKLLTILFIAIGFNSVGQDKVVSVETIQPILISHIPPYEVKTDNTFDTVKVMMLMCDTSILSGETIAGKGLVYWYIGYEVRNNISAHWGDFDRQIFAHTEITEYLDDKKNPLKPSIIVWISKQL